MCRFKYVIQRVISHYLSSKTLSMEPKSKISLISIQSASFYFGTGLSDGKVLYEESYKRAINQMRWLETSLCVTTLDPFVRPTIANSGKLRAMAFFLEKYTWKKPRNGHKSTSSRTVLTTLSFLGDGLSYSFSILSAHISLELLLPAYVLSIRQVNFSTSWYEM